jgi:hypothetical protein
MFVKKSPIRIKSLNNINIKFAIYSHCNIFLKIYLGISLLFCNANIEGIKIFDTKSFNKSDFKIEKNEKNLLILKIHNILLFEDKKFKIRIYDLINQYDYLILYLSEEIAKYKNSKKIFFNFSKKHYLFYSEFPTKAVDFIVNLDEERFWIGDEKNNNILFSNYTNKEFLFPYYSFLIQKYKVIRYTLFDEIFFIFSGKNIIYGLYRENLSINALNKCIKLMNEKYSKIFNNLYLFLNDEYNLSELNNDVLLIKNIVKKIKKFL